MTLKSWNALPQRHGVSGGKRLDPLRNRVKGHEDASQHVARVMEFVAQTMQEGAVVDVIGIVEGGELCVRYLDTHWEEWRNRIRAMAVGLNYVFRVPDEVRDPEFLRFWSKVRQPSPNHP